MGKSFSNNARTKSVLSFLKFKERRQHAMAKLSKRQKLTESSWLANTDKIPNKMTVKIRTMRRKRQVVADLRDNFTPKQRRLNLSSLRSRRHGPSPKRHEAKGKEKEVHIPGCSCTDLDDLETFASYQTRKCPGPPPQFTSPERYRSGYGLGDKTTPVQLPLPSKEVYMNAGPSTFAARQLAALGKQVKNAEDRLAQSKDPYEDSKRLAALRDAYNGVKYGYPTIAVSKADKDDSSIKRKDLSYRRPDTADEVRRAQYMKRISADEALDDPSLAHAEVQLRNARVLASMTSALSSCDSVAVAEHCEVASGSSFSLDSTTSKTGVVLSTLRKLSASFKKKPRADSGTVLLA